MRRHFVGLMALLLLLAGILCWLSGAPGAALASFTGAAVKVGAMLAVLWLAWPEVVRWDARLTAANLLGVAIVIARPKAIFLVGPILFALWFFWPRASRPRHGE